MELAEDHMASGLDLASREARCSGSRAGVHSSVSVEATVSAAAGVFEREQGQAGRLPEGVPCKTKKDLVVSSDANWLFSPTESKALAITSKAPPAKDGAPRRSLNLEDYKKRRGLI